MIENRVFILNYSYRIVVLIFDGGSRSRLSSILYFLSTFSWSERGIIHSTLIVSFFCGRASRMKEDRENMAPITNENNFAGFS